MSQPSRREVRLLDAAAAERHRSALAEVLLDCVAGGAGVSFMADLDQAQAEAFFAQVGAEVAAGERLLAAAFDEEGLVGSVQLVLATPPNQPHRAELSKMLVHRAARRQGVGAAMLALAEREARGRGKTLITLDTVTGMDGERLYARCGYQRAGVIPSYALLPDGRDSDTTLFWKKL
jgi:GNAT superfamily N-acetyltransferase